MKIIKKFAAIILVIVVLTITASALFACNRTSRTKIAIITDIHVMADAQIGNSLTKSFEDKDMSSQKLLYLSSAIFRSALDKIVEDGATTLLIAGDLTEDGAKIAHEEVASQLKKLEEKGVNAYVIPGNHDVLNSSKKYDTDVATTIPNVNREEFREIYADFGYSEALSTYEGTLSYTANIGKEYRLIAIDASNTTPSETGKPVDRNSPSMTEGLIAWAAEQVEAAIADKRTPLGMMHFPLVEHLGNFLDETGLTANGKVNKSKELAAALSKAGLNYIFTGHVHMQDIMTYEDDNGKIYDIETACLSNYPSPIRYLTSNKTSISFTTELLTGLKQDYIPAYADAEKNMLVNDYQTFAYNYVDEDMMGKILSKLSAETIAKLLKTLGVENAEGLAPLAKILVVDGIIKEFLWMDIYGKSDSVEAIAAKYGVDLPPSQYNSIMSLAMSILKSLYLGDENFTEASPEIALLKYSIYSIFSFLGDKYQAIKYFIKNIPNINLYAASKSLFETAELDISALGIDELLIPLLSKFLDVPDATTINEIMEALKNYPLEDKLFGIPVQDYIDSEKGTIKFGALLDHLIFDVAKDNIFVDAGPADNNIKISKKTLEATPI